MIVSTPTIPQQVAALHIDLISSTAKQILFQHEQLRRPPGKAGFLAKPPSRTVSFSQDPYSSSCMRFRIEGYGPITVRCKPRWRFRCPDVVRDDVLARLLDLNAASHAKEQATCVIAKTGRVKSTRSNQRSKEPRRHNDSNNAGTDHI